MRLGVGEVVGGYRVERALGTGGTAVVYLVRDVHHGAQHALKVLTVTSPVIRVRMEREGRVQAQLQHPNVVAVHEVLDLDGSPALLMEYVDGTPLDAALKRYRLTLPDAELLFSGILNGVQAAHDAGLVHRDLKPANVLLARTRHGFLPKVADFGLAKLLTPEPGAAHTRAGISMGTPSYMSPEQVRDAGSVDQRADVWSLGCLLYEVTTRHRAFPGKQALAIYNAVVRAQYAPPRSHEPDLPERIVNAIAGALQVDPEDRIPDCRTLHAVLAGSETWASSPSRSAEAVLPSDLGRQAWGQLDDDDLWTEEHSGLVDAPLMPLAGSSTEQTAPRYRPDDPPAVTGSSLPELLVDDDLEAAEVHADDLVPLGVEPGAAGEGTLSPQDSLASLPGAGRDRARGALIAALLLFGGLGATALVAGGVVGGALLASHRTPAEVEPAPSTVTPVQGATEQAARPVPSIPAPVVVAPVVRAPPVRDAPAGAPVRVVRASAPVEREVLLQSFPFGAQVYLGDAALGRAPRKLSLVVGSHWVRMTSGDQVARFEVDVAADGAGVWCYHFVRGELLAGGCTP